MAEPTVGSKAGQYSRKPAYQNTFKYQHNPKSAKTAKILASPIEGLCEHCSRLLEWKKDYRKYKPLTVPKRCTMCQQKNILNAYHILCANCATTKKLCAKCKKPSTVVKEFGEAQRQAQEEKEFELKLQNLRLRDRKKLLRMKEQEEEDDGSEDTSEGSAEANEDNSEQLEEPAAKQGQKNIKSESSEEQSEEEPLPTTQSPQSNQPSISSPSPQTNPTLNTSNPEPSKDKSAIPVFSFDAAPSSSGFTFAPDAVVVPRVDPRPMTIQTPSSSSTSSEEDLAPPPAPEPVVDSEDSGEGPIPQDELEPLTDQPFGGVKSFQFMKK